MADDTTQALRDMAGQIGGFEYSVTGQLDRVEHKVDALMQALGVPTPQITAEPPTPVPVFEEVGSQPPAAPADTPEGTGILSGIAHTVAGLEKSAVDAMRSWQERAREEREDDYYPDDRVPGAATAPVNAATHTASVMASGAPAVDGKAGDVPLGPHTQAVAERRTQPAPATAGMAV